VTKQARSLDLPAPSDVGAWLLAPLRARETPDPPRTRLGRAGRWFAGIAGVVAAVLTFTVTRSEGYPLGGPAETTVAVAALVVVLLAWHPLAAWRFAVGTAAVWLLVGSGVEFSALRVPSALLVVIMLAGVVVLGRHRRDLGWAVWFWTVVVLRLAVHDTGPFLAMLVALTLVTLVVDARRQRTRAKAEAATERQARLAQEAESLVLEERARIARELHDVVAHHMSMVAVQAETAPYRLDGLADPVREEFGSIARSARAALTDVRGILTVLRDTQADAERTPQPGLDGVEALVETARAAGAHVELSVVGRRRPLTAALEIGGYRIVQESLANAARHAPGASITAAVAYRRRDLVVTVTNGPPADPVPSGATDDAAATGGGHGLVGMRERAHLLGGEVVAGPTADGGFRVAATLPVKEATA